MARKPAEPPTPEPPSLSPAVAIARLRELLPRMRTLASSGQVSADDEQTLTFALTAELTRALGKYHEQIADIANAGAWRTFNVDGEGQAARERAARTELRAKLLEELIAQMERDLKDVVPPAPRQSGAEGVASRVETLLRRFPRIARRMRDRHAQRPTLEINDEYDVQDLLHALLALYFDDIRAEEWTPSYAGKSSRMDFLLKDEQCVVETKMTRQGLGGKEVGDELIIDIGRYGAHQDCKTLICFVYDPMARIGNPDGLERDLSGTRDGIAVKVIIAPKS